MSKAINTPEADSLPKPNIKDSRVLTYLNANTSNKVITAERKIAWTAFKIFDMTDNVVKV